MNNINVRYYKSPVGELIVGEYEGKICLCDWRYRNMRAAIDQRIRNGVGAMYVERDSSVIDDAIQQLDSYFIGELEIFDLPLYLVGTAFQKNVWRGLIKIPYGKTDSYIGFSRKLNNEKAIRAVASANGANAISIIVPCHRIIGSKGELVGYAGGLPAKKKLLHIESKNKSPEQMQLF